MRRAGETTASHLRSHLPAPYDFPVPAELSERDERILDFERKWAGRLAAKDHAIRSQFGISPARYYQVLSRLIESPAALAYDPMLVRRLLHRRDERATAR